MKHKDLKQVVIDVESMTGNKGKIVIDNPLGFVSQQFYEGVTDSELSKDSINPFRNDRIDLHKLKKFMICFEKEMKTER